MNRLVIVGNGFDLAHGLKTSYADFMFDYLKTAILAATEKRGFNDKLLNIQYQHGVVSDNNSWIDSAENYTHLKEVATNRRYWFKFHSSLFEKMLSGDINKNWVDIEKEYYLELIKIFNTNSGTNDLVVSLNEEMIVIRNLLIDYLKRTCSDFNVQTLDHKSILDLLKGNIKNEYQLEAITPKNQIRETRILNFNYTHTVSQYVKLLKDSRFSEIQIHGSYDDPRSIVFGFGDELDRHYQDMEDIDDNAYFRHIKSFGYFQNTEYQSLMKFINSGTPFEVFVLGHSLGLSDRTMFSQIFESKNLYSVKLFYYEKDDGSNDFIEKTYEISRHFKNKGRMRLKIVPFSKSECMPQIEYSDK